MNCNVFLIGIVFIGPTKQLGSGGGGSSGGSSSDSNCRHFIIKTAASAMSVNL